MTTEGHEGKVPKCLKCGSPGYVSDEVDVDGWFRILYCCRSRVEFNNCPLAPTDSVSQDEVLAPEFCGCTQAESWECRFADEAGSCPCACHVEQDDGVKVQTTSRGIRTVKAKDIIGSSRGREGLAASKKLFASAGVPDSVEPGGEEAEWELIEWAVNEIVETFVKSSSNTPVIDALHVATNIISRARLSHPVRSEDDEFGPITAEELAAARVELPHPVRTEPRPIPNWHKHLSSEAYKLLQMLSDGSKSLDQIHPYLMDRIRFFFDRAHPVRTEDEDSLDVHRRIADLIIHAVTEDRERQGDPPRLDRIRYASLSRTVFNSVRYYIEARISDACLDCGDERVCPRCESTAEGSKGTFGAHWICAEVRGALGLRDGATASEYLAAIEALRAHPVRSEPVGWKVRWRALASGMADEVLADSAFAEKALERMGQIEQDHPVGSPSQEEG